MESIVVSLGAVVGRNVDQIGFIAIETKFALRVEIGIKV